MTRYRNRLLVVIAAMVAIAASSGTSDEARQPKEASSPAARFRKPIALAWVESGRLLAVANARTGSISLVDVERKLVVGETEIASRLTDLKRAGDSDTGDSDTFVALDDKTHELLLLKIQRTGVRIIGRTRVADDPQRVIVGDDGRTALVAGRWSRRLDVVELDATGGPHVVRSHALPFAPRELLLLPDGVGVVVADAFGGRIAVIDLRKGLITIERTLDGRNIRGLSLDLRRNELLVSYQRPAERLPTTVENLRAGKLAANLLGRFSTSSLELSGTPVRLDGDVTEAKNIGAADPDDVFLLADGRSVVLLAGTQQVAIVAADGRAVARVDVGARPTAALLDPTKQLLYVADTLDDTLSIVDLAQHRTTATFALGPRPELWPRDRGERLFFDGRQSLGGFMSCHSCHTDGHTSGGLADTFGDGSYGTPKRILTLLGTSLTDHWGWNGELRELRDQVERSFLTSMHTPKHTLRDSDDVTAYLHTLPFAPPRLPKTSDVVDAQLFAAGEAVFAAERCGECHVAPLTFTSQTTYDVGLRDEAGLAKFNPPSLRGVGQGVAFLHDARMKSLDDLFRLHRHSLHADLSEAELRALVRYLQGL
ncbi:MAG: cytochrome C peroxidase [Planctomycetia bacterium]|nr:cytochrome C peroxidase [Planctomycetia bacterium]